MTAPAIFDRHARRMHRDATVALPEPFLTGLMIDEVLERLDIISRRFSDAVVIGAEPRLIAALQARGMNVSIVDPSPRRAARAGGRCADEDDGTLPIAAFDLVIAIGTLDTVDDVPGALVLLRRALRPDGVMLAIFAGAGSLPALREAASAADRAEDLAVARFHPQIDVHAAGDLLARAGFALPVADVAKFDLAYASPDQLRADLRAAGLRNALAVRHAVGKPWRAALQRSFASQARDDGRTVETIAFIVLTGWAPAPGQPLPARRGSATASLASALKEARDNRD